MKRTVIFCLLVAVRLPARGQEMPIGAGGAEAQSEEASSPLKEVLKPDILRPSGPMELPQAVSLPPPAALTDVVPVERSAHLAAPEDAKPRPILHQLEEAARAASDPEATNGSSPSGEGETAPAVVVPQGMGLETSVTTAGSLRRLRGLRKSGRFPRFVNTMIKSFDSGRRKKVPGPLRILTYRDKSGQEFLSIDLRRTLGWLEYVPNLQKKEVDFIRRIRGRVRDVQILIPEGRNKQTPDLIVEGVVTEIKSVGVSVNRNRRAEESKVEWQGQPIHDANEQIHEFNERHGLGMGALMIDLTQEKVLPIETVEKVVGDWAASVKGTPIRLRRIWFFAGKYLEVFTLQEDGRYRLDGDEAHRKEI